MTRLIGNRGQTPIPAIRPLSGGAVIVLLLAMACAYDDSVTHAYATRGEAEQAGAVERGWLPRGLPDSARELRVAHSPARQRVWGLFNFAPEDGGVLRALLQRDQISAAGLRPEIPARIEWWPVLLRGTLDGDRVSAAGLDVYRMNERGLLLVVNWKQGRAYYWG